MILMLAPPAVLPALKRRNSHAQPASNANTMIRPNSTWNMLPADDVALVVEATTGVVATVADAAANTDEAEHASGNRVKEISRRSLIDSLSDVVIGSACGYVPTAK